METNEMTPTHEFSCRMDFEPAGLERLFQVVRRRGFAIEHVTAEHDAHGLRVEMRVSGSCAPGMLQAQLQKLQTVRSVWWAAAAVCSQKHDTARCVRSLAG